jgi:hypothetical protein
VLSGVDGLGVGRNRRHALQAERAAGREDAVGRSPSPVPRRYA